MTGATTGARTTSLSELRVGSTNAEVRRSMSAVADIREGGRFVATLLGDARLTPELDKSRERVVHHRIDVSARQAEAVDDDREHQRVAFHGRDVAGQ